MRFYEWLTLVFYIGFALLCWKRPLTLRRRALITLCGAAGIVLLLLPPDVIRDWLPLVLIPLAYWQTGYFVRPLNLSLQSRLHSFDQRILRSLRAHPSITFWLELAYLLVYPLVPCGMAVLYLAGMDRFAVEFWNVVIPPAYSCYATFPFVQTLPPRALEDRSGVEPGLTGIRVLNLFVLRHVSIQANTFPSGHVAASLAIALELLRHVPAAGIVFLIVTAGIAAGAFFGRYHYGLDVLIGAALALLSFLVSLDL